MGIRQFGIYTFGLMAMLATAQSYGRTIRGDSGNWTLFDSIPQKDETSTGGVASLNAVISLINSNGNDTIFTAVDPGIGLNVPPWISQVPVPDGCGGSSSPSCYVASDDTGLYPMRASDSYLLTWNTPPSPLPDNWNPLSITAGSQIGQVGIYDVQLSPDGETTVNDWEIVFNYTENNGICAAGLESNESVRPPIFTTLLTTYAFTGGVGISSPCDSVNDFLFDRTGALVGYIGGDDSFDAQLLPGLPPGWSDLSAVITVSPASLSFGASQVGSTSAAKTVTLTNNGASTVSLNAITLGGVLANDFLLSNACGATLAPGANCTLSVSFKPVSAGGKAANVTLSDSGSGSPQSVVTLTGAGITASAPTVKLSAASLSFGNQTVNTSSAVKTSTLTNSGAASLSLTSIALTGVLADDFALTQTCGPSLPGGSSCTLSVSFKPVSAGGKSANISISDNAGGSPQSVLLTGAGITATAPTVKLSAASLSFGSQTVNTSSAVKTITLTDSGAASLSLTSIALTGVLADDFALTQTCGPSLPGGSSCTLSVSFKPVSAGGKSANISISDNAAGSPQLVTLTGTGIAALASAGN